MQEFSDSFPMQFTQGCRTATQDRDQLLSRDFNDYQRNEYNFLLFHFLHPNFVIICVRTNFTRAWSRLGRENTRDKAGDGGARRAGLS
jgi:hypothetical protein